MLRKDLKAAGVPNVIDTPEGKKYADFHALRHSFLSALAAAGVGVKELQVLARHSTPSLTIGVYTHARPEPLGAAAARLPMPFAGEANPLAPLTRDELERAVAVLLSALHLVWSVVAPRVAQPAETTGAG